jgi:(S)-sulfolactate dehydrogenase
MILITEFMDGAAVQALSAVHATTYAPALLGDAEALIVRNRTQVTKALLEAAPKLKCVGRLGVGLDNIDQAACAERGIAVIPATGANNLSVAEYVLTGAFVLLRNAYDAKDRMMAGDWPRMACAGREVSGKVLGLVGFGAIAQETATKARALGMEICAYDPFLPSDAPAWTGVHALSLDGVLESADVISLHVPLTAETRHMINAARLGRMRTGAVLINAARGGVVDEDALAAALAQGQIAGAALDVFETEPLTAAAAERFRGLGNLILTPHIAGVTVESNIRVSSLIADRVLDALRNT